MDLRGGRTWPLGQPGALFKRYDAHVSCVGMSGRSVYTRRIQKDKVLARPRNILLLKNDPFLLDCLPLPRPFVFHLPIGIPPFDSQLILTPIPPLPLPRPCPLCSPSLQVPQPRDPSGFGQSVDEHGAGRERVWFKLIMCVCFAFVFLLLISIPPHSVNCIPQLHTMRPYFDSIFSDYYLQFRFGRAPTRTATTMRASLAGERSEDPCAVRS